MSVLSALLDSDPTTFTRLDNSARRMCGRYFEQSADIDGATQDTWLLAWDHGDALRNPLKAQSWIASIAKRACLARLKNAKRERRAYDVLGVDETISGVLTGLGHTDTPVLDQEMEDDIRSLLLQLPAKERAIILEHLIDGRKWSEIAEHRGMPEGAVKKVFYRARPRLQKALAALRHRYETLEEPLPENRPPAMYVYTVADLEKSCAGLPPDALAEILEDARSNLPRRRNYDG